MGVGLVVLSVEPDTVKVTWKIVPVNPYRKKKHLEEGRDVINLNIKNTETFKGYLVSSKFLVASAFFFFFPFLDILV